MLITYVHKNETENCIPFVTKEEADAELRAKQVEIDILRKQRDEAQKIAGIQELKESCDQEIREALNDKQSK
jgi:FAD synthase